MLVNNSDQILDKKLVKKINSSIADTGNQLSQPDIVEFSRKINLNELKKYRIKVGKNTRKRIKNLQFSDFKRKFSKESLDRIFQEKAVARHPESEWLVEFWGKKNVAGIIFMPVTLSLQKSEGFKAEASRVQP